MNADFKWSTLIQGLASFNSLIDRVAARLAKPFDKAPARQIRDAYIQRIEEAFSSRGVSVGGWAPLDPLYAKYKRRKYPGRPLLVRTGEMKEALTRKGHREFVFNRRSNMLVLGSDNPIAPYHQEGTERMPDRPLFLNDRTWGEETTEIIREHIFASSLEKVFDIL